MARAGKSRQLSHAMNMMSKNAHGPNTKNEVKTTRGLETAARQLPQEAPVAQERRSSHRVADDQKTGQGSLSALSKMRMLERRREAMSPRSKEPGDDVPH